MPRRRKGVSYLYTAREYAASLPTPMRGVDSMILPAYTDGKEAWYGADIDKTKYRIVLEDGTENSVCLKIVKLPAVNK